MRFGGCVWLECAYLSIVSQARSEFIEFSEDIEWTVFRELYIGWDPVTTRYENLVLTYPKLCAGENRTAFTAFLADFPSRNTTNAEKLARLSEVEHLKLVQKAQSHRGSNQNIPRSNLLSDLNQVERRDQVISLMWMIADVFSVDMNTLFLHGLKSDIVSNLNGMGAEILEVAQALPCVIVEPDSMAFTEDIVVDDIGENETPTLNPNPIPCNDPMYSNQWYLQGTKEAQPFGANFVEAWDVTPKQQSVTTVAIVDTWIMRHPDLRDLPDGRLECGGKAAFDDDFNGYPDDCRGWDFTVGNPEYHTPNCERHCHGNSVAGIIAGMTNNSIGIASACPFCFYNFLKIAGSKDVAPAPFIVSSSAIKAYDYLVVTGGFALSLHAYIGFASIYALWYSFMMLRDIGHLMVAAAGNKGCSINWFSGHSACVRKHAWPAAYPADNILTVAASSIFGRKWVESNFGDTAVDIFAPGENILSHNKGSSEDINIQYAIYSGTGVATAQTAALAALILHHYRSFTYRDVISIIVNTSKKYPWLTGLARTPGIIDAKAATEYFGSPSMDWPENGYYFPHLIPTPSTHYALAGSAQESVFSLILFIFVFM